MKEDEDLAVQEMISLATLVIRVSGPLLRDECSIRGPLGREEFAFLTLGELMKISDFALDVEFGATELILRLPEYLQKEGAEIRRFAEVSWGNAQGLVDAGGPELEAARCKAAAFLRAIKRIVRSLCDKGP